MGAGLEMGQRQVFLITWILAPFVWLYPLLWALMRSSDCFAIADTMIIEEAVSLIFGASCGKICGGNHDGR